MAGLHIIKIGGYDYMDLGTGSFVKTPASCTSMADSFSRATIFPSLIGSSGASGYQIVGSETKNGVDTDHYQASSTTLAEYGSMLGVTAGATWSGDIWIAKSGGYPVSAAILATATDKSVAFEMSFDLSNINDSANSITAPTNNHGRLVVSGRGRPRRQGRAFRGPGYRPGPLLQVVWFWPEFQAANAIAKWCSRSRQARVAGKAVCRRTQGPSSTFLGDKTRRTRGRPGSDLTGAGSQG